MTPLLPAPRLGAEIGLPGLLVKDEGALPTGSFKARGAAVGVSRALELGATRLAMPTNGNAGAAWAAYAARAGLHLLVGMPLGAPAITRAECVVTGADLRLVDGLISDAGRLVASALAGSPDDWFDVATLKEPYRIEGKKTMGFEIAEQLGWRMPDVVVYPTGGGVGPDRHLQGAHRAGRAGLGLRSAATAGQRPVDRVRADRAGLRGRRRRVRAVGGAMTAAFGINVPKALGDFLVLEAVRATDGTAVAVDDEDILADLALAGRLEGMFLCPEGAATVTAVRRLRRDGWLGVTTRSCCSTPGPA
jgi:threonine synthase